MAPFKNKRHAGDSVGCGLKTMGMRKIVPIPRAPGRRGQWILRVRTAEPETLDQPPDLR